MAHKWEDVNQGVEGLGNYGKRRCKKCGAVQTKQSKTEWMRVVGYYWHPKVGRCNADKQGKVKV